VKPTLKPYVVIFFASDLLSDFRIKERYKNYISPFILSIPALAVMKLWNINMDLVKDPRPFRLLTESFDSMRLLKLLVTSLILFSGLLLITLILMLLRENDFRRKLIFIFPGLLNVCLICFLVIALGHNKIFPSIKRYVMLLVLPAEYLYFRKVGFDKHSKILIPVAAVFLMIRLPEAVTSINSKKVVTDICKHKPEICARSEADRIKSAQCRIKIIDRSSFNSPFDYIVYNYLSLPRMLVFSSMNELTHKIKSKGCTVLN